MHPLIEQFARIPGVDACRPDFFRRVQRELRELIQPMLDERDRLLEDRQAIVDQRDRLLEDNTALVAQLETLKKAKKAVAA